MATVNLVLLLGRLARDPDIHGLPDGETIATVTLVTGGATPEAERHRVDCFGTLATEAQYLRRGDRIYVEGRLRSRSEGEAPEKYVAIVAAKMQAIGKPGGKGKLPARGSRRAPASKSIEDIWVKIRNDIPF